MSDTASATALVLAMADLLEPFTAELDQLTDDEWDTAYWCATVLVNRHPVDGDDLRRKVRVALEERVKHPDPFQGLPA
jgi:hypothetical protein